MNKQKQAFTLVELIVVITILAILWTIAFISLQWYSRDSRDSVRISDMSSIKTTLELFHLWAGKYPLTTDGTPVLYSWTEAWTQGSFWETTVTNVEKFDKIPTDPLMDRQYVYSVTHSKQEYEIAWIIEWDTLWLNSEIINEAIAWDKVTKLKITWNYNGKFLKLSTGWVDYVLNVPSIITSTWWTLDYILANNWLAYNWYSNLSSIWWFII
jgi:prepilin-type N-terminal cleavage/methylation domain-containing protein